ncbi:Acetophenone carboxylase gamma subunit [Zhongshania aliphaticivorans]|uniref:Acetophenone carboxylase gamma subunit n=1 Tax=Zhongshania aliphaticivorans TaxID=1470434 RepID=A0A5S9Q8Y7_9GAMM|nr:hydantoinase/oxoprolinase family protein [Zhongshania aliphaticivorans]CAA0102939.1 Acetophenone carboxylase gamma subunit [Zhongshania aliphaticivorans]CAA0113823.1 Acetophenone carboxylase gamma subunit [Zhongshania aliphaticivorans]
MSLSAPLAYLGVDTGGTFTDFVLFRDQEIRCFKCPSTPANPELAILTGIAELGLVDLITDGGLVVVHGSTVATNAALEGKGAKTVFITNRGFADMLTIGRQTRDSLYDLSPPAKITPVPPTLCLEVGGRIAADGSMIEPLTAEDLSNLNHSLSVLKPESVAINLLFSFLDPSVEETIAKHLSDDLFISRSSLVLPEYKEYERGMATWLNAWLGPKVSRYLKNLQVSLKSTPISVMQSSGGTTNADNASQRAVNLLLSGPAGGLAAAKHLSQTLQRPKLMTFDMGGTSSDVALINGDIKLTSEGKIGPYPVAVPMVDMHTIGAGGGSIAYLDDGGMLRVGPESAGAAPGPACYSKGGTQATVTDANVVLGRLPASTRLGGAMQLDTNAARKAIGELATTLGISIEHTAEGIIDIANEHMVRALRVISVQRGHDPEDFSLCCFGGAGGLHICALADILHCPEIIVPNYAGVFSALGMLLAPRERQLSRTINIGLKQTDTKKLHQALSELAETGRQELLDEGVHLSQISAHSSVDLCYIGQSYTLNINWQDDLTALEYAFHRAHRERYGHELALPVQLVNIRQALRADTLSITLPKVKQGPAAQAKGIETVIVATDAGLTEKYQVPHYERAQLTINQIVTGPALISDTVATLWLTKTWQAQVDQQGHLLLRKK